MNNSIWDDTEVMAQAEDFDFYEVDPFDVTHDPSYYGLELVLPVTDTRESDQQSIKPSLDSTLGQRTAQLDDILTNQLEPLVNDIISEFFSGSILSDELTHLLGRLSVLLKEDSPNKFPSKTCYLRLFDPISNQ